MHWMAWRLPLGDEQLANMSASAIAACGWWALQFTPNVAVLDEALLLDVQSAERLWGGRAALRRLLLEHVPQSSSVPHDCADARSHWAEGPTALQALALLRLKHGGGPRPSQIPQGLPMHTLTALRPHLTTLNNLGCRTLGDVRALPRAGVARRLGAQSLLALDQLWGERACPLSWLELPGHFDLELELPYIAASSADLLHASEHLLTALQGWLRARHQGVLRLSMRWKHDLRRLDGVDLAPWGEMELRTAEPLQELSHLRRLLAEHMAHERLAAPVNRLTMKTLEIQPVRQLNESLLPKSANESDGEPWNQFVERVSARLGEDCLRVPTRQADHRPEHMQIWQSASHVMRLDAHRKADMDADPRAALWPAWLLPAPELLATRQHRPCLRGQTLSLKAGPERFESGWWEAEDALPKEGSIGPPAAPGGSKREYFVAHNAAAGWVWIFRETSTLDWYLHGFYG
ncbi:DNA polymerase Y subunit UmuC family protein [Diaphorobacter aerolatus]|uniref:DNA polymerase Y family protein n=1 Tax=Diaphorobacter aerolatus TaxID=1288495 RepID=A0A7H0GKR8_9BURK|nr:DNA polymerase Y family protein [Diaphorobacter aerolatus]QNP48884.1 DNA polymerase Y family protein [Diaphorobacter aerolatus]